MKTLIETVKALVLHQHHKALKILEKTQNSSTQISKFYTGIKTGKFTNDEAAAEAILQCSPNKQSYRNLKVKVRNRILNALFFINPNKLKIDNEHSKIAIYCHKRWTAAKILHAIGAKNAAVELAGQVLRQAEKIQISYLIMDIALYLRLHYGTIIGNQEKFDYYNKLYHQYRHIQLWEDKAQEYYIQLALYYAKSRADKSTIHKQAKSFYQEIETSISKYKTHKLIFFGGLIKLIIHMSINDYRTSIKVCEEVLKLLDSNPLFPNMGKGTFYHQQLICCIQLKLFKKGETLAKESLKFTKPSIHNWFIHQDLYFLLSMHTKNYQRAYEVIKETQNTKSFNALSDNSKEVWRIYQMYTTFMIIEGKIEAPEKDARVRLGKFLNEVPSYSQDKRGLNIAILIVQILFYIQQRKYDHAIDRIEAIKKYCSRHLRKDNNIRSNCFIRMLLQIPVALFNPIAAERKAKKYKDMLLENSIDLVNQAHSIEIVPYEDLWEIVIASLYKKKKR